MPLSVCTWNINSVRLRLPLLERLARHAAPDVICLQETKCPDEAFPSLEIAAMGYPHQALRGMKSYNGVAILSKRPLTSERSVSFCEKNDCRHIAATVDGIEIHNLYIPAGGDIPDPTINPKFAHKLQFLQELETWCLSSFGRSDPLLMVGDFNIAPLPCDVWDHRKLLKVVSHTPIEVEALHRVQSTLDWVDVARHIVAPPEPVFTWWSYRSPDWAVSNRGRRLDHLWATPALASRLTGFETVNEARGWEPPSDHIPVLMTLG